MARALVFVGLVCLAFTAAGAASVAEETDAVTGRQLLNNGQWVWFPTQFQANGGGNYANGVGTANQQSNNQAVQQYGWSNSGGNVNSQSINTAPTKDGPPPPKDGPGPGRKLLNNGGYWAWYPQQVQINGGGNIAQNTGTANQQSNNQAVQQYGWSNSGGNVNSQSINTAPTKDGPPPPKDGPGPWGRKLLNSGGYWAWYPTQFQANGGGNYANGVGTANQQSNNQAVQQWGNSNSAGNYNSQSINTAPTKDGPPPPKDGPGPGRKLLTGGGYWAWYPQQVQINGGGNIAKNTGTANQQSNNQALQQAGAWNYGVNSNSQSITTGPSDPPPKDGPPKDGPKP